MSAGYELSLSKKAIADLDDLSFYHSMHFGEREVGIFFRKLDARI